MLVIPNPTIQNSIIWTGRYGRHEALEKALVDLDSLREQTIANPEIEYVRAMLDGTDHTEPTLWNLWLTREDLTQLDFQDPAVMEWAATHGKPFIQYTFVDIEKDPDPVFPAMFTRFFWYMAFLEKFDYQRMPGDRLVFLTRQELITPDKEARSGTWIHTDGLLFLPNGECAGQIRRAWNVYNRVPTMGYLWNEKRIPLPDVKTEIMMQLAANEGIGSEERIAQYLMNIGMQFRLYGQNIITGFHGGPKGWFHMAQTLVNGHFMKQKSPDFTYDFKKHMNGYYLDNDPTSYAKIDRPFLRNMATLFVVTPQANKLSL